MMLHLGRTASARKLRLFGIACCRRIWDLCPDADFRRAVELAEGWTMGEVPQEAVREQREHMKRLHLETYATASESREAQVSFWARAAGCGTLQDPQAYAEGAPIYPGDADLRRVWSHANSVVMHYYDHLPPDLVDEGAAQAALLREVLGNPIDPTPFDPAWRTPAVVVLARSIFAERTFDRMPELGKALRAAGCREKAILNHCKSEGPHVRGCWVLDQVLEQD